jgi:hypothetical protein
MSYLKTHFLADDIPKPSCTSTAVERLRVPGWRYGTII